MKKLLLSLLLVGTMAAKARALDTGFGLGFILGSPSGLSARVALNNANALHLILGYDLNHDNDWDPDGGVLYVGGDYVWYNYSLISVPRGRLPFYFGPGLNATISSHSSLGIRGVVGLEYQFATAPFDLFLEIGPGINIMPNTDGNVTGGLGARFFF